MKFLSDLIALSWRLCLKGLFIYLLYVGIWQDPPNQGLVNVTRLLVFLDLVFSFISLAPPVVQKLVYEKKLDDLEAGFPVWFLWLYYLVVAGMMVWTGYFGILFIYTGACFLHVVLRWVVQGEVKKRDAAKGKMEDNYKHEVKF